MRNEEEEANTNNTSHQTDKDHTDRQIAKTAYPLQDLTPKEFSRLLEEAQQYSTLKVKFCTSFKVQHQ